jgi:hypothetical protein
MDYNDLYRIITAYYPIGINELDVGYLESPGIQKLLARSNRMFDSENYEGKWKPFINSFKEEANEILEVSWESPLSEWCFTGTMVVNKRDISGITHIQELVVNLSFLAPIYTVFGRDRIEYFEDGNLIEFHPFLTISPDRIYEKLFYYARKKIEIEYPGYSFISFDILSQRTKSIYVPGSVNGQDSTIYQTLFKFHDITSYPYHGDPSYK